jgi:hypothetical protein
VHTEVEVIPDFIFSEHMACNTDVDGDDDDYNHIIIIIIINSYM